MNDFEHFVFPQDTLPENINSQESLQREIEIKQVELEMRDYLKELKQNFPYVLGMLLHGSRLNK